MAFVNFMTRNDTLREFLLSFIVKRPSYVEKLMTPSFQQSYQYVLPIYLYRTDAEALKSLIKIQLFPFTRNNRISRRAPSDIYIYEI